MFGLSKPNPKDKGAKLAQAQNQAPDSIPGMFKPGEFVLPPDSVHAMGGKQALQGVVDSTHTPVAQSFGLNEARASAPQAQAAPQLGLKPEVFFANGGAPEDQLARAAISPANTFPQGSPSAGANIYAGASLSRDQFGSSGKLAQIPPGIGGNPGAPARVQPAAAPPAVTASAVPEPQVQAASTPAASPKEPAAPAVEVPAGGLSYSDNLRMQGDDIRSTWNAGNYGEAAGKTVSATLGGVTTPLIDGVVKGAGGVAGFARGIFGLGGGDSAPQSATASVAAKPGSSVSVAAAPVAGPAMANAAAANNAVKVAANNAPSGTAPVGEAAAVAPGIYNHGRGQYSDNAAGMGLPAGFTGKPNAQNMAAAANLATANAAPGVSAAQEGGFGLSAPTVAHSGNDWAARQNLKNLETSASSIMNTQRWGGKGAPHNAAVANFVDASRADLTAQGKVPDMQLKTNEVNAGLRRTAMAEAGADRRAQGQIGLGLGQLALGAQRNNLDAQRINSDERLRAPQIQAAERLGQLQDAYINAKTPEEQATIAAQMRAYSGKSGDEWQAVVLQGGTDAQGNKTESVMGAMNKNDGEMRRFDGGAKPAPSANHVEYLKKNPQYAQQFDQIYGQGAAQKVVKN